jgi:hypothetical protein
MKNISMFLFYATIALSACSYDMEYKRQSVFNVFEGDCPSGRYVLSQQNLNHPQGWKNVREFFCENGEVAKAYPSLDGKIYLRDEMVNEQRSNKFIQNIFVPGKFTAEDMRRFDKNLEKK